MPIYLRDRRTKKMYDATLLERITQSQFAEVKESWWRYKESHPPVDPPGNHAWDWLEKSRTRSTTSTSHTFLGISVEDVIQGMLMMDSYPKACKGAGLEGKSLIYVEYLESAPWNVPHYAGDGALYKGVGVNLVSAAVKYSLDWGLGGRIGLHSLDDVDTRTSYTRMGFEKLGFDAEEGYDYFEFGGYDTIAT